MIKAVLLNTSRIAGAFLAETEAVQFDTIPVGKGSPGAVDNDG